MAIVISAGASPIKRLLVANRSEIAIRIFRASYFHRHLIFRTLSQLAFLDMSNVSTRMLYPRRNGAQDLTGFAETKVSCVDRTRIRNLAALARSGSWPRGSPPRTKQRRRRRACLKDVAFNSGGVVVSYFEWVQDLQRLFWEEEEVMRREYQVLDRAFEQVQARSRKDNVFNRTAAMAIGVERVRGAKETRGLFP